MKMAPIARSKAPPKPNSNVPVVDPACCKMTGVGVGPSANMVVGVGVLVAVTQVQLDCVVHCGLRQTPPTQVRPDEHCVLDEQALLHDAGVG